MRAPQDEDKLPDRQLASEFYNKYVLKEVLGKGLSSVVRRCVHIETGQEFAVKIMDVTGGDVDADGLNLREQTLREIRILRKVAGHRHIIQLMETFDATSVIFLIFELCKNGELFDLLNNNVDLTQKNARRIMKQVLEAVKHCHSLDVIHRDLKPENILLDDNYNVKLTDFGFSKEISKETRLYEVCGTPGYLAPELLMSGMLESHCNPGYSFEVDYWACGVIMYIMLVGNPPFWHRNALRMIRLICSGKFCISGPGWEFIPDETKDLLTRFLTREPEERITIDQALAHPHFTSPGHFRVMSENDNESEELPTTEEMAVKAPREEEENGAEDGSHLLVEENAPFNPRQMFRRAFHVIQAFIRLKRLRDTPIPVECNTLINNPYQCKEFRKMMEVVAVNVYGHWIKKNEIQNRASLFQTTSLRNLKDMRNNEGDEEDSSVEQKRLNKSI